jgi:hypothetical protein
MSEVGYPSNDGMDDWNLCTGDEITRMINRLTLSCMYVRESVRSPGDLAGNVSEIASEKAKTVHSST